MLREEPNTEARGIRESAADDSGALHAESENGEPSPAEMYEDFLVPGIHARWTPIFLDYAKPEVDECVLDVACGTGIVTRSAAPAVGSNGRVVALDVSPDMLRVASEQAPEACAGVEWVQGDVHALPLEEDEFDLVLCQQALQFFEDPRRAVAEIGRVLRPEGRAVLSVWQGLDQHPLYGALSKAEAQYLDTSVEALATPFQMGDVDHLAELFDDYGRVDISQETHEVRFPSPQRFVALTLLAAASIIPESVMDEATQAEMIAAVSREIEPDLNEVTDGDEVAFPMHAHVVVARP